MMLETEIKFHLLEELEFVRERLQALGVTLARPRQFERNLRYDNAWDGLRARGALLRLRQDDRAIMTYKGVPPQGEERAEVRVREEIEVVVSDFVSADLIIRRIGFEPRQSYEKYRETWYWQEYDVEIVLDEMPFGNFMEIEGSADAIAQSAQRLQLDWSRRILNNYLALLEQFNAQFGTAITDLTFEQFVGRDCSLFQPY